MVRAVSARPYQLPTIPEDERTPLVVVLLEIIQAQREEMQALRNEVARLQQRKAKPKIGPSKLGKDPKSRKRKGKKRPGSAKRSKTPDLEIHETVIITPVDLPEGSAFRGYQDRVVQELVIRAHNTQYRLERWLTPDGVELVGPMPEALAHSHFGVTLMSYVLYLHHHGQMTQPLITEHLRDLKIEISTGQVNRILIEGKESFHEEKAEILRAGLEVSGHIHVDDTGARHRGKNGYCTHIGNEFFAWFESTERKSRINFLNLLRAGQLDYVINSDALEYMRNQKLPTFILDRFLGLEGQRFDDESHWTSALAKLKITADRHVRIATEGALFGSVLDHGLRRDLAIMSDDAGQFNILIHCLCWIHAERNIRKLLGFNDEQKAALEEVRGEIWGFYRDLQAYKQKPKPEKRVELAARFDEIFTKKTCFTTLNLALERLHKNKKELLVVLERPELPLHNNPSENDIREYVKKRKISGSTRSEKGRQCRDTFASLKKTGRKLGISFWNFLKDRVGGEGRIPLFADLIRKRAQT